jgi:hypothetical protein
VIAIAIAKSLVKRGVGTPLEPFLESPSVRCGGDCGRETQTSLILRSLKMSIELALLLATYA